MSEDSFVGAALSKYESFGSQPKARDLRLKLGATYVRTAILYQNRQSLQLVA